MAIPPAYPHYPAPHEPARRHSSRWGLWAAIAFVVVGLVAPVASIAVIVRSLEIASANYIDDPKILGVIEHECDRMTRTVDGLIVSGSPHQQAAVIKEQNAAAQRMIDAVLALDPNILAADKPTLAWTADWQQLLNARSQYAAQVERGAHPDLKEPRDADGESILDRMDWASAPECVVPESLLDPYPELIEDI